MSSATILFILQRMLQTLPEDSHNHTILGMAFGPGLTLESALLRIIYNDAQ